MKILLRPLLVLLAGLFILGARQAEELQAATAPGVVRASAQQPAQRLAPTPVINNYVPALYQRPTATLAPHTASLGEQYITVSF